MTCAKKEFPSWEAYIIYYSKRSVTSALTHLRDREYQIKYTANHTTLASSLPVVERNWTAVTRILVIDDETALVELVRSYLEREQYEVLTASDGRAALDLVRTAQPDLVVLDVMLPVLDGIEVCRQLRQFSDAYVILLTARAEEIDKILGLAVGADDYLTKPFSPRELVARIKARLRRPRQVANVLPTSSTLPDDTPAPQHWGNLAIDEAQHEVTLRGQPVELTAREFALLLALARHPGRVFTRPQLLERVWGDAYYDEHVVDVHIGNLRKKLEADPAHPEYLETVRGVGFRFRRKRE